MAKKKSGSSQRVARRKPYLVFVSHATDDKFIAKILCEKIEKLGAKTFRDDRDIEGGDSIPNTIVEHIRRCDEMIVLMTPKSVDREWVLIEIGIGVGVKRRIVPLFYHVDADSLPGIIKNSRGYHLNEIEQYLKDLKKRVKRR